MTYRNRDAVLSDVNIPNRIKAALEGGMANDWERGFLDSIGEQFAAKGSLSHGQLDVLKRIEARTSPEALAMRDAWVKTWTPEKAKTLATMLKYYKRIKYYFQGAVAKHEANPEWIPSEQEYNKICCNKYAVRYLANLAKPPKFNVGAFVVYRSYNDYEMVTVVEVKEPLDHVAGSRIYSVFGRRGMTDVRERDLRRYRGSYDKKLDASLQNS